MKPFQDYRKQFNPFLFGILLIVFLTVPVVFSNAQSAADLRNKINQKDADIAALEREIAAYQVQLDSLGKEKNSLNNSIKELDLTKKKLNTDISVTEKKIDKTNLEIKGLSEDIGDKENSISNNKESISLGIRTTSELEQENMLSIILSEDDFTSVWNDIDNMAAVQETIRENILKLKETKVKLEDTREVTVEAKKKLTSLKSKLADQQKIVVQNTKEKAALLKQTQNNEANYQKLLKDRIAKKEAFEKELENYESQLKFILDPSSIPSGRVLSWPLDKIFVTSPYAPRWGGFHRGTDFRASVGTPVKAVTDGVVKGVGDTDICCPGASFGKWIFIEHPNGLSSTYAHLSLISVANGQRIARGQVIGYSGNTGSSTGPHLHVSLYISSGVKVDSFPSKSYPGKTLVQPISATGAYLDPMKYLPAI